MTKFRGIALALLTATGAYLYTFPAATIVYFGIDLGHIAGGLIFSLVLLLALRRLERADAVVTLGWMAIAAGAAAGIALTFTGATRPLATLLYTHILLSAAGMVFLLVGYMGRSSTTRATVLRLAAFLILAAALGASAWGVREVGWRSRHQIVNPAMPPESQDFEGAGVNGDFFPS